MRAIACVIAIAACTPVPLGDGERRIVARELGDEVIVPTLHEVVARAGDLTAAARQLASTPAAPELDAAQEAWRAARTPWKHTDAFAFGPATDLRLGVAIDQVPIEPSKIELVIAGPTAISESSVEELGADAKGFHAIEYLLFGDAILATFTTGPTAARRRDLLVALAENLERKTIELRSAWSDEHATLLAQPANPTYPTIKSAIDTLVNESVFLAELVADARIGKPSGTASGGTPQPALEESAPSDNSIADMAESLRGIRNVYFGTRDGLPTEGIGRLVAEQSPATDHAVRQALEAAIRAVEAIPRPYRTALLERRLEIAFAHEAVKELRRVLATEVVGVLGSTLKFNDNDGD